MNIEADVNLQREWENISKQLSCLSDEIDSIELSPFLVPLLIAAEDHRYNSHPGVDLISMCRAVWRTFFCGKREGGSTIAMQLVRVLTGRYERTLRRKIVEIFLALRLTRNISKRDIPRLYLAVAYYGWKMNGLRAASKRLNIDMSALSQIEAAEIIARLKYPEPRYLTPWRSHQIENRAKYIMNRANRFNEMHMHFNSA